MDKQLLWTLDDLIDTLQEWRDVIGENLSTASGTRLKHWQIGLEDDIDQAVNDLRHDFHAFKSNT